MNVSFRPQWLLALALPLALAACGDKEPEQRAAFSQFLQTRIIDKPGVRVPQLTPEESKAFGDYTRDYAVITDFNGSMDASIEPMKGLVEKGAVRSINDVIARRADIESAKTGLHDMGVALKAEQAKADAAHAALKQPDDLKPVYDKAYEKTVTLPATTFLGVLPNLEATLDSSLKVADYVSAHKDQIEVNGAIVRVADPKVQAELNGLLGELNAQAKTVQEAQGRVQKVLLGR